MKFLSPVARQTFLDDNGDPLAGGKIYTYAAGSTTPKATYSDEDGTPNTNPIILDAGGKCDLWLSSGFYKFVITDADDVQIEVRDRISATSALSESESTQISTILGGRWYAPEGSGAIESEEFGQRVWKFPTPSDADVKIKRRIKIPEAYASGEIELRLGAYTPSYSTTQTSNRPTFKFQLTAGLVRKPTATDTVGYEVDDLALAETATAQISTIPGVFDPDTLSVIPGKPNAYRPLALVIATNGLLDSQAIQPGDFIDLELTRVAIDTNDETPLEDSDAIRIIEDFMEVIFS